MVLPFGVGDPEDATLLAGITSAESSWSVTPPAAGVDGLGASPGTTSPGVFNLGLADIVAAQAQSKLLAG
jgi:hypothetical protein